MLKIHRIKLSARYFEYVARRIITEELIFNNRNYQTGDWLVLEEWDEDEYTGREEMRKVKAVIPLDGMGLEGWVLICME